MKKVFLMLFTATAMMACSEAETTEVNETATEQVADSTSNEEEVIVEETIEDVTTKVEEVKTELEAIDSDIDELIK